ncbi:DNA polymerase III subunit gamma/tau [Agromyces luteolus]|uniref:DNA polymerase III subunit gamma/tau n=1 Tax=Agromyces luteolus TaxID=88373 RepID=A0A7C9MJI6_9MICO|nr:DNA polymerase III subunit gamma/tau [Agromyces luteolus]MUN08658.1 DNA polymerase III subunit gamma/tau [Agromyces luteolus]
MARESGDDDEALRWEGDDDATLAPGWKRVGEPAAAGDGVDDGDDDGDDEATEAAASARSNGDAAATADAGSAAQVGSAELVLLGVFGGAFLLYTLGWILTALRVTNTATDPVGQSMFALGLWLAVLAPALWFGVTFALTRGRVPLRFTWLAVGAVVLLPVPFVAGVTA